MGFYILELVSVSAKFLIKLKQSLMGFFAYFKDIFVQLCFDVVHSPFQVFNV